LHQNTFGGWARCPDLIGELTALLRCSSWIKDGDKGRIRRKRDGERKKWVTVGEGKGMGRGGVGPASQLTNVGRSEIS